MKVSETATVKAMVSTHLDGDKALSSLRLTLSWPESMPANKVDFVLIATNDGRSFMCLFNYGTSGTDLIYSENCHPRLAQDLKNTMEVEVTELAQTNNENRVYTCRLRHCFD